MDDQKTQYRVGMRVRARRTITENGEPPGDPSAKVLEPQWIHAQETEEGTVIYVDERQDGLPTIRFDRTGTATIVGRDEITVIAQPLDQFLAWRDQVDQDHLLDVFDMALAWFSAKGLLHEDALQLAQEAREGGGIHAIAVVALNQRPAEHIQLELPTGKGDDNN